MAKNRKPLPPGKPLDIFRRDSFACQYCGRKPPAVVLQIDHIIAHANGGSDDALNLITSCAECNIGKGAKDLQTLPESRQQQIEEQTELHAQMEEYNRFLMEGRAHENAVVRDMGFHWFNKIAGNEKDAYVFGPARDGSIRLFLKQLPQAEIMEAMDLAHARFPPYADEDERTWKYFCGVCWRKIKKDR